MVLDNPVPSLAAVMQMGKRSFCFLTSVKIKNAVRWYRGWWVTVSLHFTARRASYVSIFKYYQSVMVVSAMTELNTNFTSPCICLVVRCTYTIYICNNQPTVCKTASQITTLTKMHRYGKANHSVISKASKTATFSVTLLNTWTKTKNCNEIIHTLDCSPARIRSCIYTSDSVCVGLLKFS